MRGTEISAFDRRPSWMGSWAQQGFAIKLLLRRSTGIVVPFVMGAQSIRSCTPPHSAINVIHYGYGRSASGRSASGYADEYRAGSKVETVYQTKTVENGSRRSVN